MSPCNEPGEMPGLSLNERYQAVSEPLLYLPSNIPLLHLTGPENGHMPPVRVLRPMGCDPRQSHGLDCTAVSQNPHHPLS